MATCTWLTTLPSFSTAMACLSKELLPHNRASVREFVEGGLNCEAKAQVLVVTPPLFPGSTCVGCKRGGVGVTAGQYGR